MRKAIVRNLAHRAPRSARSAGLFMVGVMIVGVASCSKASTDKAGPAASASASPVASGSAAAPLASAKAPTAETTAWSGSYLAKVGPVAPPENAKEKTWTNDPGTDSVGQGTIALSI